MKDGLWCGGGLMPSWCCRATVSRVDILNWSGCRMLSVKRCSINKDEGLWNTAGPPFFTKRCKISQTFILFILFQVRRHPFRMDKPVLAFLPGAWDHDTKHFVADIKLLAAIFFPLKLQKALENTHCSGYQIRMWRCDRKRIKAGSAVFKGTLLTWCFATDPLPLCSERLHYEVH